MPLRTRGKRGPCIHSVLGLFEEAILAVEGGMEISTAAGTRRNDSLLCEESFFMQGAGAGQEAPICQLFPVVLRQERHGR